MPGFGSSLQRVPLMCELDWSRIRWSRVPYAKHSMRVVLPVWSLLARVWSLSACAAFAFCVEIVQLLFHCMCMWTNDVLILQTYECIICMV